MTHEMQKRTFPRLAIHTAHTVGCAQYPDNIAHLLPVPEGKIVHRMYFFVHSVSTPAAEARLILYALNPFSRGRECQQFVPYINPDLHTYTSRVDCNTWMCS